MKTKPTLIPALRARVIKALSQQGRSMTRDIASQIGISSHIISNLFRHLQKLGYVRICAITRNGALWEITDQQYPDTNKLYTKLDNKYLTKDPEHFAWMAYWRQRREQRMAKCQTPCPRV